MRRSHKYKARRTKVDGITFDSQAEARYYQELKLRQKAGQLEIVELQPKVYLTKARILYKPDFLIREGSEYVWVDRKGVTTPAFNIKKRLWKEYGPGILRIVYDKKIEEILPSGGV